MEPNTEEPSDELNANPEPYGDYSEDDAYDAYDAGTEELPDEGTRGSSGGSYLTDLADVLRRAGLSVKEQPGWETWASKRGGFRHGIQGIVVHHTAGGDPNTNGNGEVSWILNHPKDKPLANIYLSRQGLWWVLAAGQTNTNGKGGPWRNTLPVHTANLRCIGIEAGNNGKGESWPVAQQDSLIKGVAALADHYGVDTDDVLSHVEWCKPWEDAGNPARGKHDPAGPSRFGSINRKGTWDMDKFRAEVRAARGQGGSATKTETTSTTSTSTSSGTPDFPGEAKLGMKGPIVVAWQEAMIAHGHIRDTVDNHDGDFGDGMQKAVLRMQNSWGWGNAVGEAGQQTWDRMHQGS